MNDSRKIIEVIDTLVKSQSRLFLCRHIDPELFDVPNDNLKELSAGILRSFKLLCDDLHKDLTGAIQVLDTLD